MLKTILFDIHFLLTVYFGLDVYLSNEFLLIHNNKTNSIFLQKHHPSLSLHTNLYQYTFYMHIGDNKIGGIIGVKNNSEFGLTA